MSNRKTMLVCLLLTAVLLPVAVHAAIPNISGTYRTPSSTVRSPSRPPDVSSSLDTKGLSESAERTIPDQSTFLEAEELGWYGTMATQGSKQAARSVPCNRMEPILAQFTLLTEKEIRLIVERLALSRLT